jgi:Uma2 family endonuclease
MQPTDFDSLQLPLRAPRSYYPLRIRTGAPLTDAALYRLCIANPDLRIERSAQGELIVTPPTGGTTSRRNSMLTAALETWAQKDGTGVAFDSNGGFVLPNGAERAPDASWLSRTRWDALSADEQERFPPLCPDFVAELRSPSDDVDELHEKMREYLANGARLGWLIDPDSRRVWVYQPDRAAVCLEEPEAVAGDPVLPGFALRLAALW